MLNSQVHHRFNSLVETTPYRLNEIKRQRRLESIKEVAREASFSTQLNKFLFTDNPSLERERLDTNFYIGDDMPLIDVIELNGM